MNWCVKQRKNTPKPHLLCTTWIRYIFLVFALVEAMFFGYNIRPVELHAKNDLQCEIIEWMKHVFPLSQWNHCAWNIRDVPFVIRHSTLRKHSHFFAFHLSRQFLCCSSFFGLLILCHLKLYSLWRFLHSSSEQVCFDYWKKAISFLCWQKAQENMMAFNLIDLCACNTFSLSR